MEVTYLRLFSDAKGESHFEQITEVLSAGQFIPDAPPLFLSPPVDAKTVRFFGGPAGWKSDWHVSGNRNLFLLVRGVWEVQASDGDKRVIRPGELLLVEDTSGRGHRSRVCSEGESIALIIQLPE